MNNKKYVCRVVYMEIFFTFVMEIAPIRLLYKVNSEKS